MRRFGWPPRCCGGARLNGFVVAEARCFYYDSEVLRERDCTQQTDGLSHWSRMPFGAQAGLLWPPLPTSHHHHPHHHHHHQNDDDDDGHHHQLTQTMAPGLGLVMLPQLRRHRLARVAFTEVCPWANLVQPHRCHDGATRIFIFRWSNFNPRPNSSFSREGSSTSRLDCSRGAL
jgi:hypothetical protein